MTGMDSKTLMAGRVLVGIFYVMMGFGHFGKVADMAGYATAKGVPAASAAVIITGVLLLAGGLSILLGFKPKLGVIALVVFYVPVTLMMHNFWTIEDAQMRQMDMIQFFKNKALLGSALMIVAIPGPWPMSLDRRMSRNKEAA